MVFQLAHLLAIAHRVVKLLVAILEQLLPTSLNMVEECQVSQPVLNQLARCPNKPHLNSPVNKADTVAHQLNRQVNILTNKWLTEEALLALAGMVVVKHLLLSGMLPQHKTLEMASVDTKVKRHSFISRFHDGFSFTIYFFDDFVWSWRN